MNARLWLDSYVDGVQAFAGLRQCRNQRHARAFYGRLMREYTAAKGPDYADAVRRHMEGLLDVAQQQKEET